MRRTTVKWLVGVLGGMTVGSLATALWSHPVTPRKVVIVEKADTTSPVFTLDDLRDLPTSCTSVTATRTPDGLFGVTGVSADGTETVRVTVTDGTEVAKDDPTTRAEADLLQITVRSAGADGGNPETTGDVLKRSRLATVGDPTSLRVDWPDGFHETKRGVEWLVSGEFDTGNLWVDEDTGASVGLYRPTVQVHWNSVDDLGFARYAAGFFFESDDPPLGVDLTDPSKLAPKVFIGTKAIDGYVVSVALAGNDATQEKADALAASLRRSGLTCPAEPVGYAPDPYANRIVGDGWVARLIEGRAYQFCDMPTVLLTIDDRTPLEGDPADCSPHGTFAVAGARNASERFLTVVVKPPIETVQLRTPTDDVIVSSKVFPANGSPYAVALLPHPEAPDAGVVVIDALDGRHGLVERTAYRLGCNSDGRCNGFVKVPEAGGAPAG